MKIYPNLPRSKFSSSQRKLRTSPSPQSGVEDQSGDVLQRVRTRGQVRRFLVPAQNEITHSFSGEEPNPRNTVDHSPFLSEPQRFTERGKFMIYRGSGHGDSSRLNVGLY